MVFISRYVSHVNLYQNLTYSYCKLNKPPNYYLTNSLFEFDASVILRSVNSEVGV